MHSTQQESTTAFDMSGSYPYHYYQLRNPLASHPENWNNLPTEPPQIDN
jgi:hypothetical protein